MAARVEFIMGRAGSGKSRYLRHRIGACCARGEECALIVPEQFTFEAERALSETLPGGLMRAEVFSFTSLAARVLENAGVRTVFLSAQGRRMLIRRVARMQKKKLLSFGAVCERPGFAQSCDDIFSLFKRCDTGPAALLQGVEGLAEGPLRYKMHDLALLYAACEEALGEGSMRAEDALGASRAHIPASFLRGMHIFVDNCDFWAEQIYGMLEALMGCAASIAFCIRADAAADCRDRRLFENEYRAQRRLLEMAARCGCATGHTALPLADAPWGGTRHTNPALAHLEKELFAQPFRPFAQEAAEGIALHIATDMGAEAEAAAEAVQQAARRGLRYREMALLSCDLPAYAQSVQRALRARGIPYFTDASHPLSLYALPRLLQNALRCAAEGFPPRALLDLGKTGLAGVERADMEILENYMLQYGLRGEALLRPFTRGSVPAAAEAARERLTRPLAALRGALRAGKTAREKTEALYAYMDELDARGQMEALCAQLREAGRFTRMEENRQVYDTLMELFSQLHALMGDTPLGLKAFCAMFEEGLAAYEIGAIPSTADQLLFGSLDRTRARSVRALFLVGAQEGALPRSVRDEGLIDDAELGALAAAGLRTWDASAVHAAAARMDAYLALSTASEGLYISCNSEGEALPSPLLERIAEIFPSLGLFDPFALPPADAGGGFMRLLAQLRAQADGEGEADAALYAACARDAAWRERLSHVERALCCREDTKPLPAELAAALYGVSGSASRLESFNACGFKHFARYGLRLEPRREYGERRTDEGSFCHEALSLFTEALRRSPKAVEDMDEADVDALLEPILEALLLSHNGGVLAEGARMRARGRRLAARVRATARAVVGQLGAGRFRPAGTELSFGRGGRLPGIAFPLGGARYILSGKIDRLDSFTEDGTRYLRVVDYKSGGEEFDFAELYHGLKLQLPLYLAAAAALEDTVAAGLYYMPIDDPAAEEGEELETALIKRFRMRGITLRDPLVEAATDAVGYGVLSARELRAEGEAMERVMAYAVEKGRETAARIRAGEIAPRPVLQRKNKRKACDFCEYAALCRFDRRIPGFRYRSVGRMDEEAFMEQSDGKMDGSAAPRD